MSTVKLSVEVCSWYSIGSFLYANHSATVYMVLLERCKMVKVNYNTYMKWLFKLVNITVYLTPGIALLAFFMSAGKLYFKGGEACIEYTQPWVSNHGSKKGISSKLSKLPSNNDKAIANNNASNVSIMSTTQDKKVTNAKTSRSSYANMRRMASKNLLCTMLTLVSTTVHMVALTVFVQIFEKYITVDSAHHSFHYFYIGATDMTINSTCMLFVTINLWCPKFLLRYINTEQSGGDSSALSNSKVQSIRNTTTTNKNNTMDSNIQNGGNVGGRAIDKRVLDKTVHNINCSISEVIVSVSNSTDDMMFSLGNTDRDNDQMHVYDGSYINNDNDGINDWDPQEEEAIVHVYDNNCYDDCSQEMSEL
eukprot:Pgem_evm2s17157